MDALLAVNRDAILALAERHGAPDVRMFGSFARGDVTETSDVDLLVSTTEHTSAWFPAGLVVDLEDLLGCRVQVVTEDGLYWLLKRRILGEAVPL
ncbi:MAG: nucleotidyltransferase domain-containing protein [Acidobacteria bacterium]|nr:nucleotidyltransferase domain-containing protein [Acidobacteriota bacterium]